MSKYTIGELFLKFLGLYLLITAVIHMLAVTVFLFTSSSRETEYNNYLMTKSATYAVCYGILGLLILKWFNFLLRLISIKQDTGSPPESEEIKGNWASFAVALMALYLAFDGIDTLISSGVGFSKAWLFKKQYYGSLNYSEFIPQLFSAFVKITLATFMFFGRQVVVATWNKFRPLVDKAGDNQEDNPDNDE